MNLKKYITDRSKEIGIDLIGFTNADKLSELENVLKVRRERNYETEIEESDIEKRITPKKILNSANSIIVIAMSYYQNIRDNSDDKRTKGKLTKSSIGLDYHIILREKMEKLIEEIKKVKPEVEFSLGVDTTPLSDRYLAKKAGIGWYGKNSNIINDKFGSFIFLGYIITNLEIEKDLELEEKCGDCNKCIVSCPVGAIKKENKLNAKRCISYLTQTKEDIPYDLRERMSNKLYGCDTCQLVCPKNESIIKNTKSINTKDIVEYINIEELFNMSNREFKEKYGKSAFSWRGKSVIKRNAIIILANQGKKENINLLKDALKDQSPMIRKYALWAILKLDKSLGSKTLKEHIEQEKDEIVIKEIEKLKKYFKLY